MNDPSWINPKGFHAELLLGEYTSNIPFIRRPLYNFSLDHGSPLTLCTRDGLHIQPDRFIARTDAASVPRPLWWIPGCSALSYAAGAYIHDSCYRYHGIFVDVGLPEFQFRPVTFEQANDYLDQSLEASDAIIADDVYEFFVSGRVGRKNWSANFDPKLYRKYGFSI